MNDSSSLSSTASNYLCVYCFASCFALCCLYAIFTSLMEILKKTHTKTTNCRLILKWVTSVFISLTIIFRNKRAERWLWRRLVELLKIISVVIILVNSCHISKMRIQFCILSNFCTNLDYVCVIKWWRVKLGNNFTRVLSKLLEFWQNASEIIP